MPDTRTQISGQVKVDYAIRGTPRISWDMRQRFCDLQPWEFQLQVSRNGGDSYVDVGVPIINTFYALDDEQRLFGKDMRLVYRVQLTTEKDVYYSPPSQPMGMLRKRQWLVSREIIRRHTLQVKQTGLRSLDGYFLKRKVAGIACTCLDPFTNGITNHDCEFCHGTGFLDGYWRASENFMLDFSPELRNTHRDNALSRGTVNAVVGVGRFIGLPIMNRNDIWIEKDSDRRYYIHKVSNKAEINQVPIIVEAELRLAEFTDAIYAVPLDGV